MLTHHTPNLLLLHLLETDTLQHEYAPLTPAAYAAYAYADSCIPLASWRRRGPQAYLIVLRSFLTSDHGFGTITHTIRPNVALAERGVLQKQYVSYKGSAWFLAEGGEASLFIRDDSNRAALVRELKTYFATVPGIAGAYTGEEEQKLGIPAIGTTDQAPDLYLAAEPGYSFMADVQGPIVSDLPSPKGTHGYLNTDSDMQALFVISGARIRSGIDLGEITNLRVAPTIATILGVTLPAAMQEPLSQALQ